MTGKLAKFLGFIDEGLRYNNPNEDKVRLYEDTLVNSGLTKQDIEWCFKKLNKDGIIKHWEVKFAPNKTLSTYPKQADFSSTPNQTFNKVVYILSIGLANLKNYKIKPHPEDKPRFDDNDGKIYYGGKECSIPLKTNQYFFSKKMFSEPFGKRVKEIDILDLIDWAEGGKRSVYDAMRLINNRIKKDLDIENFFRWRNNSVWINEIFS